MKKNMFEKMFGFTKSQIVLKMQFGVCFVLALTMINGIFVNRVKAAEFIYVINERNAASNQIYGHQINSSTGVLTALAGFPVATGQNGGTTFVSERITIDGINQRLYVINDGANSVSAYSINAMTGALTALPFSPILLGTGNWVTIAVSRLGSNLVIGNSTGSVKSYLITASTATEAAGSPYSTGVARPYSSVFSKDGLFYYTGGNAGTTFAGFSVSPVTGVLTALAGSPFNSGGNFPLGFATDTNNRLFAGNSGDNQVRTFTTTAGVPTAVTGNPFTSGLTEEIDGALAPNENFYAVADRTGSRIGVYQVSGMGTGTTLAAVAGSPFASTSALPSALVYNSTGGFLYAAHASSRNITKWDSNTTTGVLTNQIGQPANTNGAIGQLNGIAYINTTPTAAGLSISGRVMTSNGRALSRVKILLTDQKGETIVKTSNNFGYFSFDELTAGNTFVINAFTKLYQFTPQVVTLFDSINGLNLIAQSPDSDKRVKGLKN